MIMLRVINLSNTRLQVGEDFVEAKKIKDFPVDIPVYVKKQLVSYANMHLARVFEVETKDTSVINTTTEVTNEEIVQPKSVRNRSKKK